MFHTPQALSARRAQLGAHNIKEASVYPYMEIYFVDKTCFTFPLLGEKGGKAPASIQLFTHPDDAKKLE